MKIELSGKRALVCGSTQGIGKAAAILLAEAGAEVTLLARNETRLRDVLAELSTSHGQQHQVLAADFSDASTVRAAVSGYLSAGRAFHILVNNTGGPAPGPISEADPKALSAAFEQHLLCNHALMQALVPGMKEFGYGRIINVISTSVKQPIPGLGVSNSIRGSVANWAKTLAGELAPFGITVNNVLPGPTATGRMEQILKNNAEKSGKSLEEVTSNTLKTIPIGRLAEPAEVGAAIAFLASPQAAAITGINLPVDGGRTGCL